MARPDKLPEDDELDALWSLTDSPATDTRGLAWLDALGGRCGLFLERMNAGTALNDSAPHNAAKVLREAMDRVVSDAYAVFLCEQGHERTTEILAAAALIGILQPRPELRAERVPRAILREPSRTERIAYAGAWHHARLKHGRWFTPERQDTSLAVFRDALLDLFDDNETMRALADQLGLEWVSEVTASGKGLVTVLEGDVAEALRQQAKELTDPHSKIERIMELFLACTIYAPRPEKPGYIVKATGDEGSWIRVFVDIDSLDQSQREHDPAWSGEFMAMYGAQLISEICNMNVPLEIGILIDLRQQDQPDDRDHGRLISLPPDLVKEIGSRLS